MPRPVTRRARLAAPTTVEERLTAVLAAWGTASTVAGVALAVRPATRGFGRQTAVWGFVDAAIAGVGVARRRTKGPTPAARLRRTLWLNAAADVAYLALGVGLRRSRRWRGDGAAVLVQGGFLLVLDTTAALALRRAGG